MSFIIHVYFVSYHPPNLIEDKKQSTEEIFFYVDANAIRNSFLL